MIPINNLAMKKLPNMHNIIWNNFREEIFPKRPKHDFIKITTSNNASENYQNSRTPSHYNQYLTY